MIVHNQMLHSSATIHWHGFHMHNTPWMDGVGYITQCPIAPMTSFMYRSVSHCVACFHAKGIIFSFRIICPAYNNVRADLLFAVNAELLHPAIQFSTII